MSRTGCLRHAADFPRLTKFENEAHLDYPALSATVCDKRAHFGLRDQTPFVPPAHAMQFNFPRQRHSFSKTARSWFPYIVSITSGFIFLTIIIVVTRPLSHRRASTLPAAPASPQVWIENTPPSLWLDSTKPLMPDTFAKLTPKGIELPNLNEVAKLIINDIDGRWTNGTTTLTIDAKHFRGSFASGSRVKTQDIIVRDISGQMMVVDIGRQRFVVLRRTDTLAVGGSSLNIPLELRRE